MCPVLQVDQQHNVTGAPVQPNYNTPSMSQPPNPYMPAGMMYPMQNMFPQPDMQNSGFMPNYPLYNVPPPNMPPQMCMPGMDAQNVSANF